MRPTGIVTVADGHSIAKRTVGQSIDHGAGDLDRRIVPDAIFTIAIDDVDEFDVATDRLTAT